MSCALKIINTGSYNEARAGMLTNAYFLRQTSTDVCLKMESKQVPQNHPHGVGVFVSHTPSKPAELKLPPLQSHRSKLPPVRKYPVTEQKGYYSELITTAAKPHLQVIISIHIQL